MTRINYGRLLKKDIVSDIKETAVKTKEEYQKKLEWNSREKI